MQIAPIQRKPQSPAFLAGFALASAGKTPGGISRRITFWGRDSSLEKL
jgi:hypothetical protein